MHNKKLEREREREREGHLNVEDMDKPLIQQIQ